MPLLEFLFNKVAGLQENTCVGEFLFNKVAGLQAYNSIKKRLQHRCFPVNIAKYLRTAFDRAPLVATSTYTTYAYLV